MEKLPPADPGAYLLPQSSHTWIRLLLSSMNSRQSTTCTQDAELYKSSNALKIKQLLKTTTDNLLNTQVKIKYFSKCYISQIKDIITTQSITNKRYNNTVYCSSKLCVVVII